MVEYALESKKRLAASQSSDMPNMNSKHQSRRTAPNSGHQSIRKSDSVENPASLGEVSFRPIVPK